MRPAPLPQVLDVLIVGGGPFGTAAAFRARELHLKALVIDHDDLMKRIRDYAKDKLILPDFGGGDRMEFPKAGPLIEALQFAPIDKDEMCARWKGLYRRHGVPAQIGVELTALEAKDGHWRAIAWNHNLKAEQIIEARHVVLAFGRGVPRRFDIPGDVSGLAFGLTDPLRYRRRAGVRDRRRHVRRRSGDRDLQREGAGQRSITGLLVVSRRQDAQGLEGACRRLLRRVHGQRQRSLSARQRTGCHRRR